MPLKLVAPIAGRTPHYTIRGTFRGLYVERSTGTSDRKAALRILADEQIEVERRYFEGVRPEVKTFHSAAADYMRADGEKKYLAPILRWMGTKALSEVDQSTIDRCASDLYPDATAATRNRHVYTPISAVLKRAGVERQVKRPKGWRGKRRIHWLRWKQQALPLIEAAADVNPRFGALCTFLLYCGTRLQETLRLEPEDLDLSRGFAYLGKTKNGEPQPVHLPPVVVAALSNLDLTCRTVFRLTKCGRLYTWLAKAEKASGVTIPDDVAFHIFRHTYGAHMRRLGADLSRVGRWADPASTRIYDHVETSEEARKADRLPTRRKA